MAICLLYALTGDDQDTHLDDFLRGVRRGDLDELFAHQLGLVDDLHRRTVREENKLTERMASLQEDVADKPFASMDRSRAGSVPIGDVVAAMDSCVGKLGSVVEEANRVRVETLKELVGILSPLQGVELLPSTAKQAPTIWLWSDG